MDESCPRRRARSRTPATSSRIRQVAGSRESGTRRSHANTGMWTCLWARMRANMTRGAAIRARGRSRLSSLVTRDEPRKALGDRLMSFVLVAAPGV